MKRAAGRRDVGSGPARTAFSLGADVAIACLLAALAGCQGEIPAGGAAGSGGSPAAGGGSASRASSASTSSSGGEGGDGAAGGGGSGGAGGEGLPWTYAAALDEGIRNDSYGLGTFRAPRSHGPHTGIDFLMPTGTKLFSACDGKYLAGYDAGYGNWVQVICRVPEPLAAGDTLYASLLYAHLSKTHVEATGTKPASARPIALGEALGLAGKSGNASAGGILAHLHFEVAIHGSEHAALSESHAGGGDSATNEAAERFKKHLAERCMTPTGLASKDAPVAYGRRIDPFLVLSCLVGDKPPLTKPSNQAWHRWSKSYSADTFDVDVGQE